MTGFTRTVCVEYDKNERGIYMLLEENCEYYWVYFCIGSTVEVNNSISEVFLHEVYIYIYIFSSKMLYLFENRVRKP